MINDIELFQDNFYKWLELHGVSFGDAFDGAFKVRVDLNKLKLGMVQLMQIERNQAATEALTKLRTRLDEPIGVSLFGFLPHNGEKMQEIHKLARINVKQMIDEELEQFSRPKQPLEDSQVVEVLINYLDGAIKELRYRRKELFGDPEQPKEDSHE